MKKKIMRRVLMLLAALVMCVLAAGVASAASAYPCYDSAEVGTQVPDLGAMVGYEPFTEYYSEHDITLRYKIENLNDVNSYISMLEESGFERTFYEKDSESKHDFRDWTFVNTKTGVIVELGTRCTCDLELDERFAYDDYILLDIYDNDGKDGGFINVTRNDVYVQVGHSYSLDVESVEDFLATSYVVLGNKNAITCSYSVTGYDEDTYMDKGVLKITGNSAGTSYIALGGILETKIIKVTVGKTSYTQKVSKKFPSATKYTAKPNMGSGTWKTSNSSIVSLSKKKGSTCTFTLKKAGKAKVTFKSSLGTYVYNITVYNKKSDPLRAGFIEMDSVGGIEPTIFIANNSSKTIKYVNFKVTFYNAVGDKVQNEIGYGYTQNLRIIGPIKPWTMDYFKWDPVFYNGVAKRMYVKSATVTYMNGSKKTFSIKKSFSFSTTEADKYYKYC